MRRTAQVSIGRCHASETNAWRDPDRPWQVSWWAAPLMRDVQQRPPPGTPTPGSGAIHRMTTLRASARLDTYRHTLETRPHLVPGAGLISAEHPPVTDFPARFASSTPDTSRQTIPRSQHYDPQRPKPACCITADAPNCAVVQSKPPQTAVVAIDRTRVRRPTHPRRPRPIRRPAQVARNPRIAGRDWGAAAIDSSAPGRRRCRSARLARRWRLSRRQPVAVDRRGMGGRPGPYVAAAQVPVAQLRDRPPALRAERAGL